MANITAKVVNLKGEEAGTVSLSSEVFGIKDENIQVVHEAVVVYQSNLRQATAKTKNRHEVSGSGIKPWRQKGTGRARSGDNNSPIWVGGGNVFGPKGTQNYKLNQNKKAHALALKTVLSEKVKKGLIIVDDLATAKVSTKALNASFEAIKAEGKVLLVLDSKNEKTALSARNLALVKVVGVNNVSVYDVLDANNIVISKADIKKLEEVLA